MKIKERSTKFISVMTPRIGVLVIGCFPIDHIVQPLSFLIFLAAAVAQWVKVFAPQAEGWVFEPDRDRPKSLKQIGFFVCWS